VGQQDRLVAGCTLELGADGRRVGGPAPFDLDLGHVGTVGAGDLGEPVAERADGHAQHAVARGEDVHHRGLEATGAGSRDHRDVAGRPEVRLDAVEDPGQHRGEFRAAVVDHLVRAGLADARRERGGAGDPQVGLEAVHGVLLGASLTKFDDGRRSAAGTLLC
jgi:hypothetical protein